MRVCLVHTVHNHGTLKTHQTYVPLTKKTYHNGASELTSVQQSHDVEETRYHSNICWYNTSVIDANQSDGRQSDIETLFFITQVICKSGLLICVLARCSQLTCKVVQSTLTCYDMALFPATWKGKLSVSLWKNANIKLCITTFINEMDDFHCSNFKFR